MARPLRIEDAGLYHHILNRGNERRKIFSDDADRLKFIELIGRCSERFSLNIYAYVLMTNHYHLVVKTGDANLSRAMQWLGVSYSTWYNARHKRSGHLFQGRFKSFLIEDNQYLMRMLLYIHRNPLRVKNAIVAHLREYKWSSFNALAYGNSKPEWFDIRLTLKYFDGQAKVFRQAIAAYDDKKDKLLENIWGGLILCSQSTAKQYREQLGKYLNTEKPQVRALMKSIDLRPQLEALSHKMGLTKEQQERLYIVKRGFQVKERDIIIHKLWSTNDVSLRKISSYFGLGEKAVYPANKRGLQYLKKDKTLANKLS